METKLSLNLSSAISLRVTLGPQFSQLENGANEGVSRYLLLKYYHFAKLG